MDVLKSSASHASCYMTALKKKKKKKKLYLPSKIAQYKDIPRNTVAGC